jgi:proline dehydrogenase
MLREGLLFLSESRLARKVVTHAPLAGTMARRFVAGESPEDAIAAGHAVNRLGMTATLDYLGESVSNRQEATAAADVYLDLLERIAAEGLEGNVSLKLTQMGQDIDTGFLRQNVGRILDRARELDCFVRFDMEASTHTQKTLDFLRSVRAEGYDNVGAVIQSYLFRSEADVRSLNADGIRVRLCKGAYNEPPSVAFPSKQDVDANFVALMQLLLSEGNYPGIATHDEAMITATRDYAARQRIPTSAYEFQMLYGVRRDLQQQLIADGYRVRIYIPFGEAWYPYLMRRLAERPANVLFMWNAVVKEGFGGRRRKAAARPASPTRGADGSSGPDGTR